MSHCPLASDIVPLVPTQRTTTEAHDEAVLQHNFGLGGPCVPSALNVDALQIAFGAVPDGVVFCDAPGVNNTNVRWRVRTGRASLAEASTIDRWIGNESLHMYGNAPVPVRGKDGSYFHPLIDNTDELVLFQDTLMRPLAFAYHGESDVLGIATKRFVPTSALFAGDDALYAYQGRPGAAACILTLSEHY